MSLTADDVREILELLEQSTFDELTLEMGDMKLKLRRRGAPESPAAAEPAAAPPEPKTKPKAEPAVPPAQDGVTDVPAPLLGVYYRAPKPGEPPFVEVGQKVEAESVIGIIEVMKLMNSVRAGVAGEIVEIPARNGEMVEFGQTLIRVRPG